MQMLFRKAVKNQSEKVIQPWRKMYHEYLSNNKTKLEQEAVAKKNIPEEINSRLIILGHWMCWNLMNTANVGCKKLTNMKLQLKPIHMYFEGRKAINVGQFVTERPLWHWKFENCVGHPSRVTSTINRIIKEKTLSPFCICVFAFYHIKGYIPYWHLGKKKVRKEKVIVSVIATR